MMLTPILDVHLTLVSRAGCPVSYSQHTGPQSRAVINMS
jgi:hypothetical protein